jgi:hypothetical protein
VLKPGQLPQLDAWLRSVLWDSTLPGLNYPKDDSAIGDSHLEIHRLKARLPLSNGEVKIVQGVREVFEIMAAPASTPGTALPSEGKIVLIGRQLADRKFEESFLNTVTSI